MLYKMQSQRPATYSGQLENQRRIALALYESPDESDDDDEIDEGESHVLENSPTPVSHGEQNKNVNVALVKKWLKSVIDVGIDEWFNGQGGYGRPWDIFTINLADTGSSDPNWKGELAASLSWLDIWNDDMVEPRLLDLDKLKRYARTIGLGELLMKKPKEKAPSQPPSQAPSQPPSQLPPQVPPPQLPPQVPPPPPTKESSIVPFMESTEPITTVRRRLTPKNAINGDGQEKWVVLPRVYEYILNEIKSGRWGPDGLYMSIVEIIKLVGGANAECPEKKVYPISFRIRTDIFKSRKGNKMDENSQWIQAGKWMGDRWKERTGTESGRVDCSFATLAVLDLPIGNFMEGQNRTLMKMGGWTSGVVDSIYSVPPKEYPQQWRHQEKFINSNSVLQTEKISYL